MSVFDIETYFRENRQKQVKKMTFRAGSPEAAEDIVQEAYCRAIRYGDSFTGDNFNGWFSTILNNCLREFKSAEKGHIAEEFDEEQADGVSNGNYPRKVMNEVKELISEKNSLHQEVLTLFFEHEYTAKNISEVLDVRYSKCHQIIQRFRNELKERYRE